ncbi:MAG: hypothetical protein SFV15_09465 [Polyangiaceae bacterium]|nr:hypothetical protein [Polyangiaceae bacterium]
MRLLRVELTQVGPFEAVSLSLGEGAARASTVIHGAGGVGKTSLLLAIGNTRPGAVSAILSPALVDRRSQFPTEAERLPSAVTYWSLGQDDRERQHPLCLASPSTRVCADDVQEVARRREQTVFDRVAKEGGFAYLAIPSSRWFSAQPLALNAPLRTLARYDVRGSLSFEERHDLGRETKQALAYAGIASALQSSGRPSGVDFKLLDGGMRHAVNSVVRLLGYRYEGLDPQSFEPHFAGPYRELISFDALPTAVRHLVAFAALPVRTLWGAYPGRDPRLAEAVVSVDEPELHQDAATRAGLVEALESALPCVQWLLATASPEIAASVDTSAVVALRRTDERVGVELFSGFEARTH